MTSARNHKLIRYSRKYVAKYAGRMAIVNRKKRGGIAMTIPAYGRLVGGLVMTFGTGADIVTIVAKT